jgi:hypothetical protein
MSEEIICQKCDEKQAVAECPECNLHFCIVCSEKATDKNSIHSKSKGAFVPLCPNCLKPIDR